MIDRRLTDVRHVDRMYDFPGFKSLKEWKARSDYLRRQMRLALGLWPEPARGPLSPVVTRKIERSGYSIENVYFESHPGFYVTGNLYRPSPMPSGRAFVPALLVAHGHWPEGRFVNRGPDDDSMPGLCINVALRGGIAFSYDMVGYNDSCQLEHRKFGEGERDKLALWGISLMGLQAFNSLRAADFLLSLPEVDPKRLAMTGASGGGTQTFILSALDDRIRACAPTVMVSSIMQGGCLCENAPALRVDTNNMEISALFAPKPQLLISCTGDWTSLTPEVEFPAVSRIYNLYGKQAAKRIENYHQHAGHQYNRRSREALYAWLGRIWFDRHDPEFAREHAFTVEPLDDLRIFPKGKSQAGGVDYSGLMAYLKESAKSFLSKNRPEGAEGLNRFRTEVGALMAQVLRAKQPEARDVRAGEKSWLTSESVKSSRLTLSRKGEGDLVSGILLRPKKIKGKLPLVIAVHNAGSFGVMDIVTGAPGELLDALLSKGHAVLTLDTCEATPLTGRRPRVGDLDSCYNVTSLCHRIQDILTALAWAKAQRGFSSVSLAGVNYGGAWCLLARAISNGFQRTVIDALKFKTDDDDKYFWEAFAPGIRLVGGLPAGAALSAPGALFLHNFGDAFDVSFAREAYASAKAAEKLKLEPGSVSIQAQAEWLAKGV
jgi:cephalosporin-C deacetylase-like acetyl esterase